MKKKKSSLSKFIIVMIIECILVFNSTKFIVSTFFIQNRSIISWILEIICLISIIIIAYCILVYIISYDKEEDS